MDIYGVIALVFLFIVAVLVVGDSLVLLVRDLKLAMADKVLTKEELAVIEADANLVAKSILKLISLFRNV